MNFSGVSGVCWHCNVSTCLCLCLLAPVQLTADLLILPPHPLSSIPSVDQLQHSQLLILMEWYYLSGIFNTKALLKKKN